MNWTVRRRLRARVARLGDMRIAVVMAIVEKGTFGGGVDGC